MRHECQCLLYFVPALICNRRCHRKARRRAYWCGVVAGVQMGACSRSGRRRDAQKLLIKHRHWRMQGIAAGAAVRKSRSVGWTTRNHHRHRAAIAVQDRIPAPFAIVWCPHKNSAFTKPSLSDPSILRHCDESPSSHLSLPSTCRGRRLALTMASSATGLEELLLGEIHGTVSMASPCRCPEHPPSMARAWCSPFLARTACFGSYRRASTTLRLQWGWLHRTGACRRLAISRVSPRRRRC